MEEYTDKIKKITKYNIGDVLRCVHRDDEGNYHAVEGGLQDGDNIIICGAIASRKNKTTRANAQMAFLSLEDIYGAIECIVFPKILSEYSNILQEDSLVAVSCRLSIREDEPPKLLLQSVQNLDSAVLEKKEPENCIFSLIQKTSKILRLWKKHFHRTEVIWR